MANNRCRKFRFFFFIGAAATIISALTVSICLAAKQDIIDATVKINVEKKVKDKEGKESIRFGSGTAFCYKVTDEKVMFLTAGHVLKGAESANIEYGGKVINVKKWWFKYEEHTTTDVGIITCDRKDFDKAPSQVVLLPPVLQPKEEIDVFVYGFPKGRATESVGKIKKSNFYRVVVDAKIEGGSSGSPVYNEESNMVVGIVILEDGTSVSISNLYELTGWPLINVK